MVNERLAEKLPKFLFYAVLAAAIWLYGVFAHKNDIFPYPQLSFVLDQAKLGLKAVRGDDDAGQFAYRTPETAVPRAKTYFPGSISEQPVLIYGIGVDNVMSVKIVENSGDVLHSWTLDVFDFWDDFEHLPEDMRPKSRPGGEIAGLVLLDNGDIVLNFEPAGAMRVNACGELIWRRSLLTHHSVTRADNGHFYLSGHVYQRNLPESWPQAKPATIEATVIELTADGELVDEFSVADVMRSNDLEGILYAGTQSLFGVTVDGDVFHLNDVKSFPRDMTPGIFAPGDLMISLRNLNTILVLDQETRKVKWSYIGAIVRQHDPDFLDGNRISVFDNRSLATDTMIRHARPDDVASRIVTIDARDGATEIVFEGNAKIPFFTDIMGKHQWLPNGNLLLTESRWGRVIEVDPEGKLVWEYNNVIDNGQFAGKVGFIYEATRLDENFDPLTIRSWSSTCRDG